MIPFKIIYTSLIFASGSITTYIIGKPLKKIISLSLNASEKNNSSTLSEFSMKKQNLYINEIEIQSNKFESLLSTIYDYLSLKSTLILFLVLGTCLVSLLLYQKLKKLKNKITSIFNIYDYMYSQGYYKKTEFDLLDTKLINLSNQIDFLLQISEHNTQSLNELKIHTQELKEFESVMLKQIINNYNIQSLSTLQDSFKKSSTHLTNMFNICNENIHKNALRLNKILNQNVTINNKLIYISKKIENLDSNSVSTNDNILIQDLDLSSIYIPDNVSLEASKRLEMFNNAIDTDNTFDFYTTNNKLTNHLVPFYSNKVFDSNKHFDSLFGFFIKKHVFTVYPTNFGFKFKTKQSYSCLNYNEESTSLLSKYQQLSLIKKGFIVVGSYFHTKLDNLFSQNAINTIYGKSYVFNTIINN